MMIKLTYTNNYCATTTNANGGGKIGYLGHCDKPTNAQTNHNGQNINCT